MRIDPRIVFALRNGSLGALFAAALGLASYSAGGSLTRLSYDFPFIFFAEEPVDDVLVLRMDEPSYEALDQKYYSAWDRSLHAQLLNKLKEGQARLVVFDIFFGKPDTPEHDAAFAAAIRKHGHVILPADLSPLAELEGEGFRILRPLPELLDAALDWGVGGVAESLDTDRCVRWQNLELVNLTDTKGGDATLSWAAARAMDAPVTRGVADLPSRLWLRYYGPGGALPDLSYYRALEIPSGVFSNKVVFVGGVPQTRGPSDKSDVFPTPYTRWDARFTSGVEIMATAFLNLWRGDWLNRLSTPKELAGLLAVAIVFGFGLSRLRPWLATGVALAGVILVVTIAFVMFSRNVWFAWGIIAFIQIPVAWFCALGVHTTQIRREKERLERHVTELESRPHARPAGTKLTTILGPDMTAMIPDYRLLSLVGEGSFGAVWLAHTVTREFRAVKIIRRGDFDSEKHYWREFNGIKQYEPVSRQHPGLIPVLHVGCNDQAGFYYYVMEAADDQESGRRFQAETYRPRSLASELVKRPRLSLTECVSMSLALSDALEYLHGRELVHRDIKPSNVIYVDNAPRLADIGLVTTIDRNRTQRTNLGTEGFIPPELHGLPAGDIYSLGKLMYEACMGLDRFRFPELPGTLVEGSGSAEFFALNRIILKACESDSGKRYHSAGELRTDLLDLQRILTPVQGH